MKEREVVAANPLQPRHHVVVALNVLELRAGTMEIIHMENQLVAPS